MQVIERKLFVCSDALNNNNKFWEYILRDDGSVIVKYGRVGSTCQEDPPKMMPRTELDRKIREKTNGRGKLGTPSYKPPYREITTLTATMPTGPSGPSTSASKEAIKEAAKAQLAKHDSALVKLVERLVEANKHELYKASGGQLNLDISTGIVSTPVGVITKESVIQARTVLDNISKFVKKSKFDEPDFITELNSYLMLVPQQVGHARGWHRNVIADSSALQKQTQLLDQLEASAELADARLKSATTSQVQTSLASTPNIFDANLSICTDKKAIEKINKMFKESINSRHVSSNLRPINIYEVDLPKASKAFENDGAKLSNQMLLWHGTRIFNVLSILKSGLLLPKTLSTMQLAGAMFGNGIYFSDQSTKSLNYSYGYWDGKSKDKNCFMFLFDIGMGNYYVPKSSYESLPKSGYDSTFAQPGKSGIMNNEMIVYRLSQARPRYLIEFDE